MPSLMIQMSHDDIKRLLPYAMIAETSSRSVWNTGKRKRAFSERFTETERAACYRIIQQAKDWAFRKGVPESICMSTKTYALWGILGDFCADF